ncbi:serine/threonine protein kinase [Rhodopirellula sp. JC740]|uniref:Serine/threonine protein kinase n=1 Tax=Rhodopirellula halodulae TaxID=2894198 RepID=A0ABS8NDR0_9BACT|nr:serine/threonine-protein kinase [Rhodopirellula sp. JC740]MCC9641684.1 serine/threonine protein kinase [Rhodopirellula sp. JC740]
MQDLTDSQKANNADYDAKLPQFSDEAFNKFCSTPSGEERHAFLSELDRSSPAEARLFRQLDDSGFLESLVEFDNTIEESRQWPSYAGHFLIEAIAEGGSSKVYKAKHEQTGVFYALKVPHGKDNKDSLKRLRREFEILGIVKSAHIPRAVDYSAAGDEPYLSLQLIESVNDRSNRLDRILERAESSVETKIRWFEQLLSAIDTVHAHGIVHKDLKLENVLIDPDGKVQLVDFGIAGPAWKANSRRLESDKQLGTWPYVAPEIRDGFEPSTAADIYSAGFVLYEMLTEKRVQSINVELATIDDSMTAFDVVIQRACSSNPADRYQSANEFLFAIDVAFDDYRNHEKWKALKRAATINRIILVGCLIVSFIALFAAGAAYVKQLELIRREAVGLTTEQLETFPKIASAAKEVEDGLGSLNNKSREFNKRLGALQMQIEAGASKLGQLDDLLERIESEVGPDKEFLVLVREQLADSRRALGLVVQHLHDQEHFYETFGQFGSRFDEVEEENRRLQKEVKALTEWIKAIEPRER